MMIKCGDCAFWVSDSPDAMVGECHKVPPTQIVLEPEEGYYSLWPPTGRDDACGEGMTKRQHQIKNQGNSNG